MRSWHEQFSTRFGATFIANVARAGLTFATSLIVARALGAAVYGDMSFLLASFAAVNLLLDMGTSPAFYTLLSNRRRSRIFFALYVLWTFGIQFGVTALFVGLILPDGAIRHIWLNANRPLVLLAFGATFMTTQAWAMVSMMGEAVRKTVLVQAIAVGQAVVHMVLVLVAVRFTRLTVPLLFWLLIIEYAALVMLMAPRLIRANLDVEKRSDSSDILRAFIDYCRPLLLYGWVSFAYTFADRWLLQKYAGSVQQGFFSIGQQIGTISLLATSSILNVLWKEVAEAHASGNEDVTARLYVRSRKALYFTATWVSCLLLPWSREILVATLGRSYEGAWLALALMLLFPLHQVLGQIQGTMFLARSDTKPYVWVNTIAMISSIPLTYLVLAPRTALVPGLELGATGLALKLVFLQIIAVNVQAWVLARRHSFPLDIVHQIVTPAVLFFLGMASRLVGESIVVFFPPSPVLPAMIVGAFIYALSTLPLIYRTANMVRAPVEVIAVSDRPKILLGMQS